MIGKKYREMIPEFSKKKGIPEEDIRHILNFYYKKVSEAVEGLAHPRISIVGLGHFYVRQQANTLKELEEMGYEEGPYQKILEVLRKDAEKKKETRAKQLKRRNNDTEGKDTEGLGEQIANS